jgi:deoxyribose-phosphate aldolase
MDQPALTDRPPLATYEALAKMIDHSLLRPELTEKEVADGCRLALAYDVATATVRPADVETAVRILDGSPVKVATVVGFPHGSTTTPAKLYEARDVIRRGAREIDMVLNIGKLRSRQFQFIESELGQMAETCHQSDVILKVILENAYLTDELKTLACRIATRTGCDFVKTSTGFAPTGYTEEDLKLMRTSAGPNVQIKAAGGVRTLDLAIRVYELGCTRFGATATARILDDWKARLAAQAAGASSAAVSD